MPLTLLFFKSKMLLDFFFVQVSHSSLLFASHHHARVVVVTNHHDGGLVAIFSSIPADLGFDEGKACRSRFNDDETRGDQRWHRRPWRGGSRRGEAVMRIEVGAGDDENEDRAQHKAGGGDTTRG